MSLSAGQIIDLGRIKFCDAHRRMLAEVEAVRRGGPGVVLLAEHDPVYTAGRATPAHDMRADIVPIERGGKITYHGPGQLVVYPILRLLRRDARAWLRTLEAFGIEVCRSFGLSARVGADGTGVFVEDRKVASIGVAIQHWISFHGIAINVDMDLTAYFAIRPCGLDPSSMSDLARELRRPITIDEAKQAAHASRFVLSPAAPTC